MTEHPLFYIVNSSFSLHVFVTWNFAEIDWISWTINNICTITSIITELVSCTSTPQMPPRFVCQSLVLQTKFTSIQYRLHTYNFKNTFLTTNPISHSTLTNQIDLLNLMIHNILFNYSHCCSIYFVTDSNKIKNVFSK